MIAQSTGLKGIENFYQGKINALMADINDDDMYSQYAINSKDFDGIFTENYRKQYNQIDFNNEDYIASKLNYELEHNTAGYEAANQALINATNELATNTENYNNLIVQQAQLSTKIQTDERGEVWTKNFKSSAIKEAGLFSDKRHFFDNDIVKANKDIESYFSDLSIFGDTSETVQQLQTKFKDLLGENNVLNDSEIKDFISQIEQARIELVKSLLNGTETSLNEIDGLLSEDKQKEAQAEIDKLKESAKTAITGQYAEQLRMASGLGEDDTEYYDYFTGLLDENERLNFNNSNKIDWYKQVQGNLELLAKEKTNVQAAIDAKPGAEMEKALQSRLDDLIEIEKILKDLNNEKLTEAIVQIDNWEDSKNRAKIINTTISQLIGKNEKNTTFSVFDAWVKALERDVEETALADERFKDLINADSSAENGYNIKEGKEKEFQELRNQIVSGYIADFTAFDDYLSVYKILAESFDNNNEYQKARDYINSKEIKDARLVNSRLIQAMQEDLKNGNISAKTEGVLAYNQQVLDSEKIVSTYQKMDQFANAYKDNLDYDEAFALQEQLLADGDIAWESFVQMDGDARKAYLESRKQAALDAAIVAQKELAKNASDRQKEVYATEEEYNKDKQLLSIFDSNFRKNQNGEYEYINDPNIKATKEATEYYEGLREKTQSYDTYGKEKENAESIANALEIINSDGERAVDKINRMKNAISELPKDMEEFNKLVKQLGNIEPKKLVEMSDLERAKLILSDLQKPTEAQFTTIDKETQKEVFNAAGYAEAMQAYEEARQSAVNVILESADAAFTQIENRMNHAREEAEKIQNAAQILSDSIATGELTETQKINIPENFLTDWEAAANASERAVVAMRMWNESARQQEEAANEILTTYEQASELLYLSAHTLEKFNFSDEEQGKIDFTKMLSESNMDKALIDVWVQAWDNVKASGKDFTNMSNRSIIETLRAEINNMKDLTEEQKKAIFAGVADNMTNLFTELSNNTIEEAEKATQAWLNAFDAINKAKRTLMSGGNLAEQIAGNPEEFMRLMQNSDYANNPQEFYKAVMSGQITADNLGMKEDFPYQALYESKIGNSTLAQLYKDNQSIFNMGEVFNEMGYFSNRDMAQQTLEGFKSQYDLSAITPEEMNDVYNTLIQTHKNDLLETLGYIPSTDDKGKLIYKNADDQIIAEDVLKKAYMSAVTPLLDYFGEEYTEGDFDNIFLKMMTKGNMLLSVMELSTKAYQEQAKQQNALTEIEHKADINNLTESQIQEQKIGINGQYGSYEEYQRLQEAIERAQEAKYSGESFESLSAADQDLLKQYNIDFSNVDTAATDCASALAACAKAAYELAVQSANKNNYYVNSDEQFEKGYTEEQGRNLYGTDWDSYKETLRQEDGVFFTGEINKEITDLIRDAYDNLAELTNKAIDTPKNTEKLKMSEYGLDPQAVDEFGDYIAEASDEIEGLSEDLKNNGEAADEVAKDVMRYGNAVKLVKDNIKDWKKALNSDDLLLQSEAVQELDKAYSDMLDLDYDSLSKSFLSNTDNLKLMEEAANGSTEAYDELLSKAHEDIKANMILDKSKFDGPYNEVLSQMDAMSFRDMEVGASLDIGNFLSSLEQMVNAAGLTAEQATNLLSSMGIDAEIESHPVEETDQATFTGAVPIVRSIPVLASLPLFGKTLAGSVPMINYIPTPVQTTSPKKTTGFTLKVKSAHKSSGGNFKHSNSGGSGGGKGGGGGSSSQKKDVKPMIRGRDEIERYHTNNDTIDRLASSLDKIDKLKDRAYGKDHLAQLNAETNALEKQLAAQQALHDEARKWMVADKADLAKYGAEYDENGTISNYETVMEHIIDEYNSAIERYNNSGQGDGDKLALEAAEQIFEDAKKAIENYEEALTIANDSANEMLEIQNQMSELEVEKITYELELKIDMNERDLELLEYYQDKYEDQLSKQDELFNTFLGSMAEYESNLANLGTAYEQLNAKFAAGLINEADYAEAVADLQSQIVDNLSSLNEIQTELVDTYANTLSLAREEVEKTTDAIDHSNEAMQSFMDIMALSGLETDYKRIGEFYKIMNNNNLTKLEVQRAHLDALLAEEQRFKDKVGEMTDLEKQQYAALQEEIQDTRDTLLSSTQEALETIRSTYENTINDIAKNLDNFMAGAAGSMSYLQEQYGYFQEQQDRYVSTAKELYEVSKLSRDIEGTLATATTDASKEALKALQEKINKQSELNELTEYDIEMNQLQYQLLLARIQLEEAQNAKDVVRLTRDENGNYAYRYTANQDKIDEAAQHYEDVLQQINDTTVQRTSEIEQQLLNTMATYKEKFQEVANDYTLTESERLMKLQDLNSQFAETMRYLQEQNNIVTENLTANQEAIAEHYGVSMSEITASTAGNINDTVQSMMDKTEEYINAMNAAIFGENGAQTAWYEYMSQIGDIEGVAGTAYENMLEDAQDMGQMNEFAAEEALEVIQTLEDTLQPLADLSAAWDAHNAILEATIADYEQLAENINAALAVASEFANTVGVGSADGSELNMAALGMISTNEVDLEDVYESYQDIIEETRKDTTLTDEAKGQILESYNEALASIISAFGAIEAGSLATPNYNEVLEQSVQIAAEFPNVTNHTEVEEALMNLINQAAQFAQRKN